MDGWVASSRERRIRHRLKLPRKVVRRSDGMWMKESGFPVRRVQGDGQDIFSFMNDALVYYYCASGHVIVACCPVVVDDAFGRGAPLPPLACVFLLIDDFILNPFRV